MKVSSCNSIRLPSSTPTLSYQKMCSEEGVYKLAPGEDNLYGISEGDRLVVVRCAGQVAVLYFNPTTGVLQPAAGDWSTRKFVRVPEAEVVFEIRGEKRP